MERLIGTLRREFLDQVIDFNERHLDRVIREYLDYYHRNRTHRVLERDCLVPRKVEGPFKAILSNFPLSEDCITDMLVERPETSRGRIVSLSSSEGSSDEPEQAAKYASSMELEAAMASIRFQKPNTRPSNWSLL